MVARTKKPRLATGTAAKEIGAHRDGWREHPGRIIWHMGLRRLSGEGSRFLLGANQLLGNQPRGRDKLKSSEFFLFLFMATSVSRSTSVSIASWTRATALEPVGHEGLEGAGEA